MSSGANLPGDLRRITDAFRANSTGAQQVMKGLSAAQLNWQPREGKGWSILQCFEHLTLTSKGYLGELWPVVKGNNPSKTPRRGELEPGFIGSFLIANLEPPPKFKTPTLDKLMPASQLDAEKVLADYIQSNEEVCFALEAGSALDLNSLEMKNPFVPMLSMKLSTAFLLMAAHGRRHIWQAGRVREALEASGQTTR